MRLALPRDRRLLADLRRFGIPEVPSLGACRLVDAEEDLPPHTHGGCMEIHCIKRGSPVFMVGGRLHRLRGGDLFVTWPEEVHDTGGLPLGRGVYYWIQIRVPARPARFCGLAGDGARRLARALRTLPARHFRGTPEAERLFEGIVERVHGRFSPLAGVEVGARLAVWLALVVECARAHRAKRVSKAIRAAAETIRRDLGRELTMDAVAAAAGLSPTRFQHRFAEEMGLPSRDHLLACRVERAAALLRGTRRTVTDIAFDVGFSSSQYFATVFRRYTALAPETYRHPVPRPRRRIPPEENLHPAAAPRA